MEYDRQHSPSFRHKLKKTSIICNSCFNYFDEEDEDDQRILEVSENNNNKPSLSSWIRLELPEIKERCASLFFGKIHRNRHRGNSAEFRYDPLSYALNFEDDRSRINDDYPFRNFSDRFPPSPVPEKKNVVVSREIAAWS